MALNDFNRITALDPEGPAAQAKLFRMDRITKVDGVDLPGQLAAEAKGKSAMMLTVERPPIKAFHDIAEHETAPDCKAPFRFLQPTDLVGDRAAPSTSEAERVDQLLALYPSVLSSYTCMVICIPC